MQITGGLWRGRKLPLTIASVRPTTARARGTLFNWLSGRLEGRLCLDLFAGSGGLSLEALSRGADRATLLEINHACCTRIQRSISLLNCGDRARLIRTDCRQWLQRNKNPERPWNLVFADPPYGLQQVGDKLKLLCENALVAPDSLLYLETAAGAPGAPAPWLLERESRQNDSWLRLYRLPAEMDDAENPQNTL